MIDYDSMTRADISDLTSPRRFEGHGLSWNAYAAALKLLDAIWRERRVGNTAFGVIGPQPSWEDTIQRGRLLFKWKAGQNSTRTEPP